MVRPFAAAGTDYGSISHASSFTVKDRCLMLLITHTRAAASTLPTSSNRLGRTSKNQTHIAINPLYNNRSKARARTQSSAPAPHRDRPPRINNHCTILRRTQPRPIKRLIDTPPDRLSHSPPPAGLEPATSTSPPPLTPGWAPPRHLPARPTITGAVALAWASDPKGCASAAAPP
jgi:hypothetical protein